MPDTPHEPDEIFKRFVRMHDELRAEIRDIRKESKELRGMIGDLLQLGMTLQEAVAELLRRGLTLPNLQSVVGKIASTFFNPWAREQDRGAR